MGFFDIGTLRAMLTLDNSQYKKATDESVKGTESLSKGLINVQTGGMLAGAGLAAMAAEAVYATNRVADFADQIKDVATITGMSTDQVQRWKYAADQSGVSFEALSTVMRMFTQNLSHIGDGTSDMAVTLSALGVSVKDANGNFRDTNTLMMETLAALQGMEDPVRRNTLAMQLYGRSWSELADFMEKDVDLAKLMSNAKPISNADIVAADNYGKKMKALGSELDMVHVKIGTKLIPAFNAIATWFSLYGVPAITGFMDIVNRGINNMVILNLKALDFLNGALGRSTNYVQRFEDSLAEEVRRNNAAMSGSYSAAMGIPTLDIGSVSGTGVSTSISGGVSVKAGSEVAAALKPVSPTLQEIAKTISYTDFIGLSGTAQTSLIKAGYNPYVNNETGYSPAVTPGETTYSASFGHMLSKLSSRTGLSPAAQAVIDKYYNRNSVTAQAEQDLSILRTKPNSPEAQAVMTRLLKERGPMVGDSSVEGMIDYLQSSLQAGSIHDQYITPTGNEYNALKSEWDRLTGGNNPVLNQSGNVIVYVQVDGQTVAQALVNKLRLLGANV